MNAIQFVVVLAIVISIFCTLVYVLVRKPKRFKENDFVEVERPEKPRPVVSLEDAPLAQVFRIASDDPTDRFEAWAADLTRREPVRENYYMSIVEEYGKSWKHPFIPDMHPLQWVRIIASNYEEARKVATHYSGGYYAVIQDQRQFNDIKDIYFTRGEYEVLDAATYFNFLKNEAL